MSILEVRDLVYGYDSPRGFVPIVDHVDLDLAAGESLGVIGESGSGKSSLLYAVMRILKRNTRIASGSVKFKGDDLSRISAERLGDIRWSGMSMVFQGAMNALNPIIRIGSILGEAYARHHPRASRAEIRDRVQEILDLVRVPSHVRTAFAHELSGGMRQRVVIALALICHPDVLLADEPTTALDVVLQDEIMARLEEIRAKLRFGMILVSHDLALIAETSNRVMVMYAGQIVETGAVRDVIDRPRHPYTIGLLQSYPSLQDMQRVPISIPGSPPTPETAFRGCRFAPRCPMAEPACLDWVSELSAVEETGAAHKVRCRRVDEVDACAASLYRNQRSDA
ncbi:ABC transporter ATP-binding protein [Microvirga alba]|uniref:ABC transporter ATP-binding protein n=1 Tax=Microvirga alba TaxID=2791025 RepID=A0A931BTY7_9HYPH|nr:ABC transporter ATP-binding protein [Microvirga alba]MBF9235674.1 ABC transporter ATP-binding protein [Microvirga alba]